MKFVLLSTFSLLASVANAFHVVSPGSITACSPLTIEYDTRSGQAPFDLAFHNDTGSGAVLAAFTGVTGTSYTWDQVTIAAGTNVVIILSDSSGKGSYTPAITVSQGSSDVCVNNPTSIPTIPTFTTSFPATSTFSGLSSLPLSSISSSLSSEISSSLSSLSSVISSASSVGSGLTVTTSTSQPSSTTGLGTNGGVTNGAGVFTIGALSAIVGAFLA